MSVQPDVDWDIEEELTNEKKHYQRAYEAPPVGTLYVALCGALTRVRKGITLQRDDPDFCPDCVANDPWL